MPKKLVSNEEIITKINKVEDFLKKRSENKKTIIRFPSKNENDTQSDTPANVVIAEAFDQLEQVVIGGLDKEGRWWFSMSMQDDSKALWIIENFKMAVLESALDMEYNEGREI